MTLPFCHFPTESRYLGDVGSQYPFRARAQGDICQLFISCWREFNNCCSSCVGIYLSSCDNASGAAGPHFFLGFKWATGSPGSRGWMGIYSHSSSPSKVLSCSSLLTMVSMLTDGLCKLICMEVPTHEGSSSSLAISYFGAEGGNST